ncbi:uncharacterized protein LOC120846612 isoform X2 [Ixodes scapularis]|uniref:uncharacterized protein LOC120846612 isoform X2 n=1 Tax=Ixodes scapularis TaxID=6945 RepID=UPI001AD65D5C|nr:uncharacterized protein LOC120846612 isoform X2 [Ixodes scapularis]
MASVSIMVNYSWPEPEPGQSTCWPEPGPGPQSKVRAHPRPGLSAQQSLRIWLCFLYEADHEAVADWSVARKFLWEGRKRKLTFRNLHLAECIINAVQSCHKCEDFKLETMATD